MRASCCRPRSGGPVASWTAPCLEGVLPLQTPGELSVARGQRGARPSGAQVTARRVAVPAPGGPRSPSLPRGPWAKPLAWTLWAWWPGDHRLDRSLVALAMWGPGCQAWGGGGQAGGFVWEAGARPPPHTWLCPDPGGWASRGAVPRERPPGPTGPWELRAHSQQDTGREDTAWGCRFPGSWPAPRDDGREPDLKAPNRAASTPGAGAAGAAGPEPGRTASPPTAGRPRAPPQGYPEAGQSLGPLPGSPPSSRRALGSCHGAGGCDHL